MPHHMHLMHCRSPHSTSSPAPRGVSPFPSCPQLTLTPFTDASSWNRARPIQKANIVLATALSLAPPNLRLLQQRSITPLGYQCYTVPRHGRAIYPVQSNRSQYGVGHSLQKERKRRNFPLIPDGDGDSNAASRTPENQKLLACNRRPKYRSRRTFPSNKPKGKKSMGLDHTTELSPSSRCYEFRKELKKKTA